MTRIKGTVKWFDINKGFGVVEDESGTTYRFRWKDILDGRLFKGYKENDIVEIEPATDRNGRDVANNVVLIKKASYSRSYDIDTDSKELNREQDID